jgi:3-oxoacyl-ACP reductase-like protein
MFLSPPPAIVAPQLNTTREYSNASAVACPTAPHTEINEKGEIVYSEVNRENVRKLEAYVEEMASADHISGSANIQKIQDDVVKLWNVVKSQPEISEETKESYQSSL